MQSWQSLSTSYGIKHLFAKSIHSCWSPGCNMLIPVWKHAENREENLQDCWYIQHTSCATRDLFVSWGHCLMLFRNIVFRNFWLSGSPPIASAVRGLHGRGPGPRPVPGPWEVIFPMARAGPANEGWFFLTGRHMRGDFFQRASKWGVIFSNGPAHDGWFFFLRAG